MINKSASPLRYPGGKSCLSNFIRDLAHRNGLVGGTYAELYAGGAGAALNLLFDNTFSNVHINDYDFHVYAMWYAILNDTDNFIKKIEKTPITISEWKNQQHLYREGRKIATTDLGFSTFFLNRTNRSGIIFKAGPIGGISQTGNYKIDVRFNKPDLIKRILQIADFRDKILLTNLDATYIINNNNRFYPDQESIFYYLDPPYFKKGKMLYLNNYDSANHANLAKTISRAMQDLKWLISYDNVPEIRSLYSNYRMSSFSLNYTLQSKKFGSELLVFSDNLTISDTITINSRTSQLEFL